MSRDIKLSVVMPTFNCADVIAPALESVKWADEILVVDMGSSDKTIDIANMFGAKVIHHIPNDGNFDKNRKIAMEQAKGRWILKLDSDERLSKDLQEEIKLIIRPKNSNVYDGYYLYNHIFIFGHRIKFGFVKPRSHELRLVRRGRWRYNPTRFHQQILIDGSVGFTTGHYYHFCNKTVSEFINKMNLYTSLDSKILSEIGNISLLTIVLAPVWTFLRLFFFQKGFLDGFVGFEVSVLYSIYNLIEKIKIWEAQGNQVAKSI